MIRKSLILLAAIGAVISAAGQQRFVADKVVAVVGGSMVLYSEVVRQAAEMTEQYRQQNFTSEREPMAEALEALLERKLLYQRAQIDSIGLENMAPMVAQAAEADIEMMIAEAGSIKALEIEQNKPIYSIREDLQKDIEEYYGAVQMRNWVGDQVKVTPGEVDKFYRAYDPDSLPIVPEQYVYAQITRLPKSVELAKQRTRERLLDLRQRIIDGERFDRLAVMYSVDPGSALRGGEMDPQTPDSFVAPFAEALKKLQPGQVSGVVETEYGFHLIQLIDVEGGLYRSRHILLRPTYTADETAETISFLDSLSGVIRRGDITFEQAALQFSDDKASRMNGGIVSNQQLLYRYAGETSPKQTRTRFVRDAIEALDAQQLIRMKEGDISAPFMGQDLQMNEMGKIVKLVQVIPAHRANPSEDWLDLEQLTLQRKQDSHYREWLDAKIDEMYVRIDPIFTVDNFQNRRWFK